MAATLATAAIALSVAHPIALILTSIFSVGFAAAAVAGLGQGVSFRAGLTSINAAVAARWRLVTPETITFRSFDGADIEGWYYPAAGAEKPPAASVPMLLSIHGGPHGISADGLTITGEGLHNGLVEAWAVTLPSSCYANCDGSTANPSLTANDFQCFLNKFAAGCS